MATVDLVMPKMGESIMEATILKWHKNPGDRVKMDETVLEIATDKVDSEVPSTAEGILDEVMFNINDVVPIGTVIARIKTAARGKPAASASAPAPQAEQPRQQAPPAPSPRQQPESQPQASASSGNRFYSPLVLNIAAQEGVSMGELEKMPGTGNEGRVTKRDILQYVSDKRSGKVQAPKPAQSQPAHSAPSNGSDQQMVIPMNKVQPSSPAGYNGNVEIIEMDRMRKLIADHMVRSKHTSPHVTSFTEADVTNLVMW